MDRQLTVGNKNDESEEAVDAKNFYDLGIDVEKIAQGVGHTVETVKQWLEFSGDN